MYLVVYKGLNDQTSQSLKFLLLKQRWSERTIKVQLICILWHLYA